MSALPFGDLPQYRRRRWLPREMACEDWAQIRPFFDELERKAPECQSAQELESWLLDWSELSAAIDEAGTLRYIAMTCHTDDPEAERAYLHFVEKIEPEVKPRQFKLALQYVEHPRRAELPQARYEVFDRDTKNQVELFRPENVALETEESRLSQQYQKLSGSLTVQFQGEERTLIQMGKYLEETDRPLRQEAWELVANRRLQELEKFESLFDQLVAVRTQIARNAGFEDYRDFAFRKLGRFDYGPQDCVRFHKAVELEIMPVLKKLQEERRERLGLEKLRPWDLAVDPLGRKPLRPFEDVEVMVERTHGIFDRLDPELAKGFEEMRELKLLDLANRKGKAPGGYQSNLAETRLPFIFMNAVGLQRDVETLLHEAGHAFHALETRDEDVYAYRNPPIEICEVASMSMELLGNELLEKFYPEQDKRRARRAHLEHVIEIFPWIATIDAFQHWVYTHPGHSRDERKKAWLELMDRFGGAVDWSGHEQAREYLWHRQLHLFIHAFYYIEYGIAQLGALQVWANARRNKAEALSRYKQALRLGGARPLPELFETAGCPFEFGPERMRPLARMVSEELGRLRVDAGA